MRFVSEVIAPETITDSYWFVFQNDILVMKDASGIDALFHGSTLNFPILRQHYLGKLNNIPVFAAEIEQFNGDAHFRAGNLKQLYEALGEPLFDIASRALQVLNWDRNHQFCGRCAAPLQMKLDERAKQCSQCNLLVYPRISPCVIVLIHHEDQLLLARSPHFRPGIYSTLAGFIEPGESAEEAVHREVKEEVGIEIKNLRYVGSQSWPFPDSFMLGFIAEYASGELKIDPKEIEDAKWFKRDDLPPLPLSISIAHKLIAGYMASIRKPN